MKKRTQARLPDGRTVDLYSIGELAFRIGRTTDTVRKWEIAGIIPATCFHNKYGCRLYTLEQINMIVDTATECRISRGRCIATSGFPEKLARRMKPLIDSYLRE